MHDDIAREYIRELYRELGPLVFAEVLRKNATADYVTSCASHDYCDANIPMAKAFETVTGREPDVKNDDDVNLWNRSQEFARTYYLTERREHDD